MRCLLRNILVSLILFSIICSCDNSRKQDRLETVSVDSITELPLPSVPSGITTTEDRAAFVARHFWDALDFRSDPLAVDTAFMEQNFANFISVLAVTPQDRAGEAVQGLCKMALGNPDAFSLLESVAEKYLDDPNSPMRDEETYIHFLRHISEAPFLSDVERIRPRHRLADALKNRPGSQAADFGFVDRSGSSTTLMRELAPNPLNLLIFYDPDCSQCKEIMGRLSALALPQEVGIIAVDVEDDHDAWQRTKDSLPARWQVGFATTPVLDDGLYVLAASPTLYLLDSTGKVILKDPPVDQAIAALTR